MSFTTEYITSIAPPVPLPGGLDKISWTASPSMPAGDVFQVYLGSALAYSGAAPTCAIAVPPGMTERVTIGSVDAADALTNYGTSLPAAPNRRIRISVPPLPPPLNAMGGRLTYVVNDAGEAPGVLPTVTLDWLPLPG
jgi:hypothetical protein